MLFISICAVCSPACPAASRFAGFGCAECGTKSAKPCGHGLRSVSDYSDGTSGIDTACEYDGVG